MGLTAAIPVPLSDFTEWLETQPRVSQSGEWIWHDFKEWSLQINVQLHGRPSSYVAAETYWHLVILSQASLDNSVVKLYPDKLGGITATFPHQTHNGVGDPKKAWRSGYPCLDLPIGKLKRVSWDEEPAELLPRLQWHVNRLLRWVDAAAADELISTGDPLEIPDFRDASVSGVIGFSEATKGVRRMEGEEARWGYASLSAVPGALKTWALTERQDQHANVLEKVDWSSSISESRQTFSAVWVRLLVLPVLKPWRRPGTWQELTQMVEAEGIDLALIFTKAGIRYRSERRPPKPFRLLLCFPLAEHVGQKPTRLHWLALEHIPLADKHSKRDGFRPSEQNHRRWDSEIAQSSANLRWQKTMNWAPDQLRTRGEAESKVRSKRFLIIGAGTLGAAVAENLLRMGVTAMCIMDGQRFETGNLSRHVLTMADAGHNKAVALARRLNSCMPDAKVEGLSSEFPPQETKGWALVDQCDVIVDCSASDEVLNAVAAYPWDCEKTFVSLSMTWRAAGLLAFTATEAAFPALDAKARFNAAPTPIVDFSEARMEGVGCWLPVFPAAADDVQLWAAIGSKFIRGAVINPARKCAYFRQSIDGEVERVEV